MQAPTICTLITTREKDTRLLKLMLDKDNESGPMGSGGYAIKKGKDLADSTVHVTLQQMDCAPAYVYNVFIKDGKIWTLTMHGWVTKLLGEKGINFSSETVRVPLIIKQEMDKRKIG